MDKENSLAGPLRHAILSGLDLLPIAFLVLDKRGKILLANDAARDIIDEGSVVLAVDNILSIHSIHHNKIFRELIRPGDPASPRTATGLAVPRAPGKPLSILVVPIARDHSAAPGHAASLVFLSDPGLPMRPDTILLTRLFGFTPAESKVASLLMQGFTVSEAAVKLNITPHTARNHLKRLFSKTNTKKQGELVYTLLSSPAFLRFASAAGV